MKRLFLVDAYALIFKYYYAFINRPMRNREGLNTSAIFGFVKFIRDIQRREHPDLLGVAFDPKGGCFRGDIFPAYKANRDATPEDIILSVPYIKQILEAMRIPILEVKGFEADDVIGTLSNKGAEAGYEVFMVTPDKDYGQLVNERCKIYKQRGQDGSIEIVDKAAIKERYGIDDPILVRDILALWGDVADNIPGVPGIGEKTACKLVQQWGTVENILAHVAEIKGKQGEKIASWEENLKLAKVLTAIRLDVPIDLDEEGLKICPPDIERLKALFSELDFHAFMLDLPNQPAEALSAQQGGDARGVGTEEKQATLESQGDLFSSLAEGNPSTSQKKAVATSSQPDLFSAIEGNNSTAEKTGAEGTQGAAKEEVVAASQQESTPTLLMALTTPHNYHLVEDEEALRKVVEEFSTLSEFCFDTETTGFDHFNDRIVGLSLSKQAHEAWYVAFTQENTPRFTEIVRPLFENENIAKIGQNIKFDLMVLRQLGITLRGRLIDTMLLHYLIDPESRHNMNALSVRYLNYQPIEIESLIGKGARQLSMEQVNIDAIKEYAAEDADITFQLKEVLMPMIQEGGLEKLYNEIEAPMIEVLAQIEWNGVKIDVDDLADYAVELRAKLEKLEQEIRQEAEEPSLNVNSPKQLGEVLFGKMHITDKPKMTKTKQYCTDEEYLLTFSSTHHIVALILEYRGIKKLLSTYVEALPQLVNRKTGRIHTSFNQAVTATGRLSSTNPNLQNIPIRDELGKRIRKAFIPSDEEHLILAADYSQVELRLMAHLSDDKALIDAFLHGKDVHSSTAALLFHKSIEEVTPEERRRAKTANFGIIYGISAFGLSQRLNLPRKEAKEIIDGYFLSYPKVKEYMDKVVADARQTGYVTTLCGRRRFLNDINSRNAVARGLAERNAVNAPIQGSAADIMKLAMIEVHRRFKAENIRSKVILQVHDELVVDMLKEEQDKVVRILKESMEGAAHLSIPLTADTGIGHNWLEAH